MYTISPKHFGMTLEQGGPFLNSGLSYSLIASSVKRSGSLIFSNEVGLKVYSRELSIATSNISYNTFAARIEMRTMKNEKQNVFESFMHLSH